jgi:DNA-binding beta-propeller fold protein YncE
LEHILSVMRLLFLICFSLFNLLAYAQEIAFTIPEKDLIPEGIAHDPTTNKLYVSSTYKRKIIEIDMATGKSKEFIREAQDDIPGVIGMRVDAKRRHLWACAATAGEGMPVRGLENNNDKTGLYQYDLKSGKLLQHYTIEKDTLFHFINDVAITSDGQVFVTDTGNGKLYKASSNGRLELFYTFNGYAPNGIDVADNGDLIIAVYGKPNAFIRLNPKTKSLKTIALPGNEQVGADGLYSYKNYLIAIQPSHRDRVVAIYPLTSEATIGTEVQTIIDPNNASLFQPTTGVVVGNEFYFIANSQLQHFRKLHREGKGKYSMDLLRDVVIMKVKLP